MLENKVELYKNELEVVKRIKELINEGYTEEHMYIIVTDDEDISMLRGSTGIMIKKEKDSIFDKFKSFLTGDDSIIDAFNKMDLDEEYRDACYNEVKDGKILLMANEDYESEFELSEDGTMIPREGIEENPEDINDERDFVSDKEKLPHDMKKDLGFDVSEEKNKSNTLLNEQIARSDIKNK